MKSNFDLSQILLGTFKTSILLILLEIMTSAILPALGIIDFKPEFNVLIILFLAFKLNMTGVVYIILFLQLIHSLFSIEGWAMGTFVGVLIYLSIGHIKELLSFTTSISTIIVVQLFQLIWFTLYSFFLSIKIGTLDNYFVILWSYIPQSFVLSLISPLFFKLLDRFWIIKDKNHGARA